MANSYSVQSSGSSRSCNCIGPQNGQPLCPCMMGSVRVVDGRYVKTEDLGPVFKAPRTESRKERIARLERELAELKNEEHSGG